MTEATDPAWVVPGAQVATIGRGYDRNPWLSTIERLTKTQIVLSNGRRYHRKNRRPVGDYYGPELMSVDDPQVLDALARQELSALEGLVEKASKHFRGGRKDVLHLVMGIEEAVACVRKRVERLCSDQEPNDKEEVQQ